MSDGDALDTGQLSEAETAALTKLAGLVQNLTQAFQAWTVENCTELSQKQGKFKLSVSKRERIKRATIRRQIFSCVFSDRMDSCDQANSWVNDRRVWYQL